jgi:hypothetical protein
MVQLFGRLRWFTLLLGLVLLAASGSSTKAQKPTNSPSDTVRAFYKALHEKRFREAFDMSIYKAAIDGLKPEEMEDLRPDFEKVAAAIPDKIEINGEEISGDAAIVFTKVPNGEVPAQTEPVALMRMDGRWIIGDKESYEIVKKAGNKFFFDARINTHHDEVQAVLVRINIAQLAYAQQHQGLFADLPALIAAGLIGKDLEGTDSTGYHFHLELAKDGKTFTVGAEPAQYGRTGKLSFFMDREGVRSGDLGGKPLIPPAVRP